MDSLKWALGFISSLPTKHPKVTMLAAVVGMYMLWQRRRRARYDAEYYMPLTETASEQKADPDFRVVGVKGDLQLEDVPTLVEEMRVSFETGVSRPYAKRIEQLHALRRMMLENKERIIDALAEDLGRPRFEANIYDFAIPVKEIEHMISHLRDWMRPERRGFNLLSFPSEDLVYREPFGEVLVLGTWNYPVMLTIVPLAGAIAAGNTVVLKPSNVSAAVAKLIGELVTAYMDPRIVTVIGPAMRGDRHCIQALIKERWDYIFFTGGVTVGRQVAEAAAKHLTPTTLELGGKNPVFVAADADIELAAKRTIWGRMMNCGQQCIAPDYVLCDESVVTEFEAACRKYLDVFYKGEQKKPGVVGRIVNDRHVARLQQMVDDGIASGGKFVAGKGEIDPSERYIEPSVLRLPLDSPAMADETFGPILILCTVSGMDEAIRYVNSRAKPLSLYVFSESKAVQEKVIQNTSSGGVTVNATLFHAGHPDLPFGGVGDSGSGAYHGQESFNTFTHRRAVLRKTALPDGGLLSDPFFLYPPWTGAKPKILDALLKLV